MDLDHAKLATKNSPLLYSTRSLIFECPSFLNVKQIYAMESLSDTVWDIVLSGTGLSQSLLALYVFPQFTRRKSDLSD